MTFQMHGSPGTEIRIRKKTRSLQSWATERLAKSRLRTGNPEFDEAFLVESENAMTALRFVSDEMQRSLLSFDRAVDVRFGKGNFILSIDEIVKSDATLDRLLELAVSAQGALRHLAGDRAARREQE